MPENSGGTAEKGIMDEGEGDKQAYRSRKNSEAGGTDMVRRILPKQEEGNSPPLDSILPARSAKRRCVSSACIPCRRRKSKCDGASPACSTCLAVYQTECTYDFDGDHRRKGALKRDIEQLKEKNDSLDVIVATIRSASESEVCEIVGHIREHGSLADIVRCIKENTTMPDCEVHSGSEADLSEIVDKFRTGDSKHSCVLWSGIHSVDSERMGSTDSRQYSGSWTRVTSDIEFISDLMSLYFTWSHPSYVLFSKSCFLSDMSRGRNKYCSSLLVNAILALACHYSDREEARETCSLAIMADHFFQEAKRILATEGEAPCLTSVQALALMSLREAGCGRNSSGWMYSGRAFRMALDLGLNLRLDWPGFSPTETEVRKITFWGCFTLDKMWSMFLGRIPQLPSTIVGVSKPSVFPPIESELWQPYTDHGVPHGTPQSGRVQGVAIYFAEVSEILGDVLTLLYSPKERVTLQILNATYSRLKDWKAQLPEDMAPKSSSLPSALLLHLYYHCTIGLLFRPFFAKELTFFGESPREICRQAAKDSAKVFALFREGYSLRRTVITSSQIILAMTLLMLIDLPSSPAIETTIVQCLKDLRELSSVWAWCASALQGIEKLVGRLNVELPEEAWDTLSAPPSSSPMHEQNINTVRTTYDLMPGDSQQYPKVKIEVPHDFVEVNENDTTWGNMANDDFQFVDSMISFPGQYEDWGCIASEI
ncbi:hypothetical protein L873DRAFT_1758261 [Choiromyces venosus 120613-1]|uniref:Zn(2)-C6 fungal-type domain-containing protein n=1 Tax=Choiromyces venosus 120613-1 TaxID=1336337 RepID=A0A3N4K4M7_9PEZI|nr:hypothetical protein L873DRAFT_1758261 [Choiromyces venosus 120613-1]